MAIISLKICGMRDQQNIREVAGLGPDFMGFIFYRGTPRFVGDDFALPPDLPASIKRVGVFVNETTEQILDKVEAFGLSYVQLHGAEPVAQCRELKTLGVGVVKVFSVDDEMDFGVTKEFATTVDYFLFDTKGKLYGGNARRFNWDVLARYDQHTPFFLSGGITPDHIGEIRKLKDLNLAAIDVNSGAEIQPGLKDLNKIKAIKNTLNNVCL